MKRISPAGFSLFEAMAVAFYWNDCDGGVDSECRERASRISDLRSELDEFGGCSPKLAVCFAVKQNQHMTTHFLFAAGRHRGVCQARPPIQAALMPTTLRWNCKHR